MGKRIAINDLRAEISALVSKIESELPDIVQELAITATAKIRNRIQEKGLKADGTSLEDYSEKYENRKAKRYGEESVTHTNLTLSGNMWRETGITDVVLQGDGVSVVVSGRTSDAQDKINWNSLRYGDILRVSDDEQKELDGDFDEAIQIIIDKSGFNE